MERLKIRARQCEPKKNDWWDIMYFYNGEKVAFSASKGHLISFSIFMGGYKYPEIVNLFKISKGSSADLVIDFLEQEAAAKEWQSLNSGYGK